MLNNIKYMNKLVSVMVLFLLLVDIQAQDTAHVSLSSILQQVEANYPSIIQYQYNIQSIREKSEGAVAWMPPTFSVGAMRFPYNISMLNEINDPMNQAGISVSLEQMIPNASKLNAKKNYISSLAAIELSKSQWTVNELRRETKKLYYSRYVAERKQHVVDESEDLLTLLLSTAEQIFSNNQSKLQTIYKAKARLAELKNMRLMLNGLVAANSIGLNILMVRDVSTPFTIDTLITPGIALSTFTDTVSVSSRSDIAAVSNSIRSMKLEREWMDLGSRPDFGIKAEHAQMFGMPNQWSIMGMMTIPFVPWSSRMYTSEVAAIGFQIQAMEQEKQTMELMAKRMQAEILIMLISERAQYENYRKEIIPAFENNLQANLIAYKQNTGDYFVLLDAWEMLLMRKLELYDKLFNVLKLEADYEYENEIR